jgi:hypothetical protein
MSNTHVNSAARAASPFGRRKPMTLVSLKGSSHFAYAREKL